MNKLKELYGRLPNNTIIRVAIVSAIVGATLLLLPFVIGGITGWFAYTRITSPGMKYAVVGAVAVLALFIGFPWTHALFNTQAAQTSNEGVAVPKAIDSTPITPASNAAIQAPQPKIEKQTATETAVMPYEKQSVDDSSLARGKTSVKTRGVNGTKTLTYEITLTDGIQTDKRQVSESVTLAPIAEVTAVGTKSASSTSSTGTESQSGCDPNYSGACVPIDSDVDCQGGSGNGPSYVKGPVTVVKNDIYKLDNDHDGIGCN